MARLRVFISSTYFDLRVVRSELDRFVTDHGFECVEHEQNGIPWDKDVALEDSCYAEIGTCQMLVSVVGGRFGTESAGLSQYSISQRELREAQAVGKQVYIFVERDILQEHRTWKLNRQREADTTIEPIKFASVDDTRIFRFLDEVYSLTKNNAIFPFGTAHDITKTLKDQWAGLFQKLLQLQEERAQFKLLQELRETSKSLQAIAIELRSTLRFASRIPSERRFGGSGLQKAIRDALKLNYEPSINTLEELDSVLSAAGVELASTTDESAANYRYYSGSTCTIFVHNSLWNSNGDIHHIEPSNWESSLVVQGQAGETDLPTRRDA